MNPVIIAVAITGSVPRKKDNPAVPVTVAEQVESTHEAYEAGATLVHLHVRNPDQSSSSDPGLFASVLEGSPGPGTGGLTELRLRPACGWAPVAARSLSDAWPRIRAGVPRACFCFARNAALASVPAQIA